MSVQSNRVATSQEIAPAGAADDPSLARRARLFDLSGRFHVGNLVTRSPNGLLHARPMTVALLDADAGELGFLTLMDFDVVRDAALDPMVSVVFQNGRHHIGWSGRAHLEHERSRVLSCWRPDLARWFPEGPDDPHLVLLVVRALRAEYWSASVVVGALRAIGASSAAVYEADASPARHGKVFFDGDLAPSPSDW